MNDHERLFAYAEGFFARAQKTEWPTVRQAARALGWTHQRVEEAAEGDPEARLFLSRHNVDPEPPLGDHFVESYG